MTTDDDVPPVRVAVGLLTFRRPDQLSSGLPEVTAQVEALASKTGVPSEVIVVDNDPEESARKYVLGYATDHPSVRYVAEPTPGIATARQRCLDEARGADLLQFIDDDETPADGWLLSMVTTWNRFGEPAAVAGCVRPQYQSPPSRFVEEGGFFVRREYPTGERLSVIRSGNLLLDLRQIRRLGLSFDTRLGLRGGEDTVLTRQLTARGGQIVFCAESIVYDLVPDDRNQRSWVLRRAWHQGSTHSFLSLWEEPRAARRTALRITLILGGLARIAVGCARALLGRMRRSIAYEARALRLVWRGRGILEGAIAPTPPEYQR